MHHLALAEVVAAAVGAELGDLGVEVVDAPPVEMALETGPEGAARAIVAVVAGILAARRPFRWDPELGTDLLRGTFDEEPSSGVGRHLTPLLHMPLPPPGTGGGPVADGLDQGPADGLVGDRLLREVELEQAHRTLDVDTDRPGIDVRRRNEDAADRGPVAAVPVGIEDEVGDAGGEAGIDRLLEADGVERRADRRRADDGDRLRRGAGGEDPGRITGGNDLMHGTAFRKVGRSPGHSPPQRRNRLPNRSIAHRGRPVENAFARAVPRPSALRGKPQVIEKKPLPSTHRRRDQAPPKGISISLDRRLS